MKQFSFKILWTVIRRTHMDKLVYTFVAALFVCALIVMVSEPGINTYGDALWYCFVACTTIGFGDFAAVTIVGRLATVYIALHEIIMVAVIPGVVVSYYLEVVHRRENEILMGYMDKLEQLPELSKEELIEIAEKVKKMR